jgi:hypothetical protein
MTNLLYTGRLIVDASLDGVIEAIRNAKYDETEVNKGKMVRLDDTTLDRNPIDTLDAIEYAITFYSNQMR